MVNNPAVLAIPFSEIPIGTILPWYGSTTVVPPAKYRFCDGSTFTENQFPELYQVLVASGNPQLTDGLPALQIRFPDLRGMFLRGYDPQRVGQIDTDPARTYVGHIQADMIKEHMHRIRNFTFLAFIQGAALRGGSDHPGWMEKVPEPGTDMGKDLGYETRPINANVAFLIRAEI
jgi:hypothetical protein